MKKFLKICLLSAIVCVVLLMIFICAYVGSLEEWKAFDPAVLQKMDRSLVLYDDLDRPYLTLDNGQNRSYCSVKELPKHVTDAFLAIEDARFYRHKGIDPIRIFGAILSDLKSLSLKEGASTITQQLIKLSVLSTDKTLARKTNEMMMALKTERRYSKLEILELYLNKVYFGRGAYGIAAASESYFGCTPKELSAAQAATLAAMLKSPAGYSPEEHPEKCRKRRNLVLSEMKKNGMLTEAEYDSARKEPLRVCDKNDDYLYGYYTDNALTSAKNILGISMSELLSGGYHIYTALDPELQSYAEELMQDDANFPDPAADGMRAECAVVAEQAKTGLICALIGGREHTARLGFSRATEMRRQPGSAIKPVLVFAPAIEYGGYSATSFLMDQPTRYADYSPRNSGGRYRGWVTLRDAVAYSINIPAVSLFEELGIRRCKAYAESVGIRFNTRDNNLSLALGGFTEGVTPMELAGAYQPFANGGVYRKSDTVRKITDDSGTVLYDYENNPSYNVLSEESAFLVTSMLHSAVEYGTAKNLAASAVPLSAKTGTSTYEDAVNNKDAWVAAYNPEYIICTWMGFDQADAKHSLQKGETGGGHPALLTGKLFTHLYRQRKAPEFRTPQGIREVLLDGELLSKELRTVPVSSAGEHTVTEYFRKDQAPKLYENDTGYRSVYSEFAFRDLQ